MQYNGSLCHYGVKGMKWGVRRRARHDAKEFARAKMFYGEGAGTRRKLIRNTVKERSKDPDYKTAFDYYSSKQDMAKHVQKAKAERHRKDVSNSVKKNTRGVVNILRGRPELAGASLAALAAGVGVAHKTGADKIILEQGKKAFSKVAESAKTAMGMTYINGMRVKVRK